MRVSDLLDHKGHDVATITADRPIGEAIDELRERSIGALVVVEDAGPVGILSERDVVRALRDDVDVRALSVQTLMSGDLTVCRPATTVVELMSTMTERRIRHVPVLDESGMCGIVSIGDVVKARLEELEHERRDLLDYVSAR